ncbi:glycosyltransferase family 4 protein [Acinetobacter variabilis]|uniref:glycosyltransferase family 4 protein n=1 Tax=Acinetobacter variabilis TaxID=70346 RepID=UPI001330EA7F|nr:glycosyltransferase family 4 protein [Acinetobacter variabilis]
MKKIILIGTVASSLYGFRADLIKALIKQGHVVYAFTSEYSESDLKKIETLGAIPITYQLNRGGLNPFADIITTYKLSRKIKKISPDLVFSYFSKPVIFGTLAARIAQVPHVIGMLEGLGYTFTDQPEGLSKKTQLIKSIQILLYKVALPRLNKIIFLNSDDPKDLLEMHKIPTQHIEILGGIGLNLKNYSYSPASVTKAIRFLFIGRLLKEKGIHDFIAAAHIVKEKYPETIFTVLGNIDTANMGALSQEELNHLINSNLIEYPGHVSDVQAWIQESHVFVLPSYREGVPRSTQEAMAIGRAVITTDVAGCRETLIDGINGFLVPRWSPQALAEKMIYFIEHPEQIKIMGDASYHIAKEKFDAEKVNHRLINILGL